MITVQPELDINRSCMPTSQLQFPCCVGSVLLPLRKECHLAVVRVREKWVHCAKRIKPPQGFNTTALDAWAGAGRRCAGDQEGTDSSTRRARGPDFKPRVMEGRVPPSPLHPPTHPFVQEVASPVKMLPRKQKARKRKSILQVKT